jgi:membrane fusion protein (multidrug efflux system)
VDRDARRIGQRRHPAQGRRLPAPAVYKEGQFVHAGDLLFEIDPRQFTAGLEQAQGALGQAEAQLAKTSKDVERFSPLAAERAISQQELDNALSAERAAKAALASAKAACGPVGAEHGLTRITSPIEGIVGIAKSQVGDLVGTSTVMTTVSTVDPIRVSFGISEKEYLRFAAQINRPNYATTEQGPVLSLLARRRKRLPGERTRRARGTARWMRAPGP